jgi:hypothetical protein
MAKTKRVEREKKAAPPRERAQAESKETNPLFEPAFSESTPPQSRPLIEEDPQSRNTEEETTRLSVSSDEAVLDTTLCAQSKESTKPFQEEDSTKPFHKPFQEEDSTKPLHKPFQEEDSTKPFHKPFQEEDSTKPFHKPFQEEDSTKPFHKPFQEEDSTKPFHKPFHEEDSVKPFHEEDTLEDEGSTEVNYDADSADEEQHLASRNPLSCIPTQEPASQHEVEVMKESPNAAESTKPVLDGRRILEIAEKKEIRGIGI